MKIVLLVVLILLGLILLPFLFLFICGLFVDTRKQYERDSKFYRALLDGSTTVILWCLGVRYKISGEEKFPETGNFLFISNHRSNYDPIIQWTVFKRYKLSFISKKENFRIPMYGRIIHRCCFMPIDRSDPGKALSTIKTATEILQKGDMAVGVYPEGTRNRQGGLLPFHTGVFRIAQKAHAPIVVMAIHGTENIYRNVLRRRSDVYIDVVDVLSLIHI